MSAKNIKNFLMIKKIRLFLLAVISVLTIFSVSDILAEEKTDTDKKAKEETAEKKPDFRFFYIGTGATYETSFQAGGLIASAITVPPGARECSKGGVCGVHDMIVMAQSTFGAAMNAVNIGDGKMSAALIHSDIAYKANYGKSIFKESSALDKLRAVSMIYKEKLHLVVRKDSGIETIKDIVGKNVSLGARGSGTLEGVREVIRLFNIQEKDIKTFYQGTGDSIDSLLAGKLDGFFVFAAVPFVPVARMIEDNRAELVNIKIKMAENNFYKSSVIEKEKYNLEEDLFSLETGTMLVLSVNVTEKLAYNITKALWHERNREAFETHPSGSFVKFDEAINNLSIPLHEGAKRFYKEKGLLKDVF